MKILIVMPHSPLPVNSGHATRAFYLLKYLATRHKVSVLTCGTEKDLKLFIKELGHIVEEVHMVGEPWQRRYPVLAELHSRWSSNSHFYNRYHTEQMQEKIDYLISKKGFDAVHCEQSVMGNFNFGNDVIKVLNTHNVEFENSGKIEEGTRFLFKKKFYKSEHSKFFNEEISVFRKQNVILSPSAEDRRIIKKVVPDVPNFVIANGVDSSYFRPSISIRPEPYSLVFTGTMAYPPNHEGIHYFLDEIFPFILMKLPQAKIYIVGKQPPKKLKGRASGTVIVTGEVADVRPYIWGSSVFVVPIRMGNGTPFKVLEALSMGKPVVSTSTGCKGVDVKNGTSIIIQDDPKAFAESVIRLLKDPDSGKQITETGHKLVKQRYDWKIIGENLLTVYDYFSVPKKVKPVWRKLPSMEG